MQNLIRERTRDDPSFCRLCDKLENADYMIKGYGFVLPVGKSCLAVLRDNLEALRPPRAPRNSWREPIPPRSEVLPFGTKG